MIFIIAFLVSCEGFMATGTIKNIALIQPLS